MDATLWCIAPLNGVIRWGCQDAKVKFVETHETKSQSRAKKQRIEKFVFYKDVR